MSSKSTQVRVNLLPIKQKRKGAGWIKRNAMPIIFIPLFLGGAVAFVFINAQQDTSVVSTNSVYQNPTQPHQAQPATVVNSSKCLFGREATLHSFEGKSSSDEMALVKLSYKGARNSKMPHFVFTSSISDTELRRLARTKENICFDLAKDQSGVVSLYPVKK